MFDLRSFHKKLLLQGLARRDTCQLQGTLITADLSRNIEQCDHAIESRRMFRCSFEKCTVGKIEDQKSYYCSDINYRYIPYAIYHISYNIIISYIWVCVKTMEPQKTMVGIIIFITKLVFLGVPNFNTHIQSLRQLRLVRVAQSHMPRLSRRSFVKSVSCQKSVGSQRCRST